MNNEAFQKMVRDGSGKSTKQIARAAVEAEFRKRRKGGKKRKLGDDYSSESDNDDDGRDRRPPPKDSKLLFRPTQVKVAASIEGQEEASEKYRDRAKERREGGAAPRFTKEEDKSSSSSALAAAVDPDVNLPVATKGLDLTLVRKEREQLQRKAGEEGGISEGDSDADEVSLASQTLPTVDQARRSLEKLVSDPYSYSSIPTELAEYMIQFARTALLWKDQPNKKIVCGVEGKTLQRTSLVMSVESHPSDRRRAWEIPRDRIHPNAQEYPIVPLLSHEMLDSLERFFPPKSKKNSQVALSSTTEIKDAAESSVALAKEETIHSKPSQLKDTETKPDTTMNDEDDDDDIFGGLDDYVPPKVDTK